MFLFGEMQIDEVNSIVEAITGMSLLKQILTYIHKGKK